MTDHLLNQTLAAEQSRLAAYYTRGLARHEDLTLASLAEAVAAGDLSFSAAVDEMTAEYVRRGGDLDRLDDFRDRAMTRLADAALRVERGEPAVPVPLAVLSPLSGPRAMQGLGIDLDTEWTRDQINGALAGRKIDGEKITGKSYAKVRNLPVDPKTGERRVSHPIGSYDFNTNADKSVSVAWGFAQPAEAALIYNAHIDATRAAQAFVIERIALARFGKGGEEESAPGEVAILEFTHHTARRVQFSSNADGEVTLTPDVSLAGDPDLHTHSLIPNAVFCADGRVGSLDSRQIGSFLKEGGSVYQATLARELRKAGFDVVRDERTGAARMTAIPAGICEVFSKRTNAGMAAARAFTAARGEKWDDLSPDQQAARAKAATQSLDQKIKGGKDDVADVADWRRQAKDAGWEPPRSFMAYGPPAPALTYEQRIRMAYEAALPEIEDLFQRKSVITHWELRTAAGRGLTHAGLEGIQDYDAVTALMKREGVRQYGEMTALVWGQNDEKRAVSITTALHEAQELEFLALAKAAAQDRSAALPSDLLERKITASGLDFSGDHGQAQLALIRRLGAGGRLGIGLAAAGAGKTAALKPLVAAWREQGREVYGASLAWRQADDLADAGIPQRNVLAFSVLIDAAKAGKIGLGRNTVIAVDELGLLGTRQGLELLRLREQHGFSIVALGDEKQCAAVEAGAIIDLSRRALGAEHVPEIVTTLRQQSEREREIVGLFREGRAREALDMKIADGTAEMVWGGRREAVERVAKLYAERLIATGAAPSVSAPTNADAHSLSVAIREQRRAMGLVGRDLKRITVADPDGGSSKLVLAVADRVRLFKSTGARFSDGRGGNIGRNGSVLEVLAVDDRGMTARSLKTGREGWIAWTSLADKEGRVRLAYGDVQTIHASQGSTASEHILALPGGSQTVSGLQAYSGGTRHVHRSYLITSENAERMEVAQRRPLNDRRELTTDDKWANVARNFSHQPQKEGALEVLGQLRTLRRGTALSFPQTFQRIEQRRQHGEPSSPMREKREVRRQGAFTPAIERLRIQVGRIAHLAYERLRSRTQHTSRQQQRSGPRMSL